MGDMVEFTPSKLPVSVPVPVPVNSSSPAPSRTPPFREDCWSEDATWTLVNAWGSRFVDLNRGNLRQKDWQFVADSVNTVHAHDVKTTRTDVQCKNRIDTLKKKFKAEKAKALEVAAAAGGAEFVSVWPFFNKMDELIGAIVGAKRASPVVTPVTGVNQDVPMGIPIYRRPAVQPISMQLPMKRTAPAQTLALAPAPAPAPSPSPVSVQVPLSAQGPAVDDSYFRRNYSAVAAAAAAEGEDGDNGEDSDSSEEETEEGSDGDGMGRLAKAIEKLGEKYERIEMDKQRLKIELEKQRMQFTKEMEIQKMQLFMDTQIQLQKIKRAKRSGSNDFCS